MRISDWSSDVCSSDLRHAGAEAAERVLEHHLHLLAPRSQVFLRQMIEGLSLEADAAFGFDQSQDRLAESGLAGIGFADDAQSSEERRVGNECGSTGRTRWSPCL